MTHIIYGAFLKVSKGTTKVPALAKTHCGLDLKMDYKFCPACGTDVSNFIDFCKEEVQDYYPGDVIYDHFDEDGESWNQVYGVRQIVCDAVDETVIAVLGFNNARTHMDMVHFSHCNSEKQRLEEFSKDGWLYNLIQEFKEYGMEVEIISGAFIEE